MMVFFITGNPGKPGCTEAVERIRRHLSGRAEIAGVSLGLDGQLPDRHLDAVISLGGDGTMLALINRVIARRIPLLGINFGRMGFLTAGMESDLESILDACLAGRTRISERMTLKLTLPCGRELNALNDCVLASPELARVATFKVRVSEEPLFSVRGDGLIVATPTGSTAHSLSAGGSIVDPRMEAILLTPMNQQSLSSRPLVVSADTVIQVEITDGPAAVHVLCDGRHVDELGRDGKLIVRRAPETARLIQPADFRFIQRLRHKLGWGRGPGEGEET